MRFPFLDQPSTTGPSATNDPIEFLQQIINGLSQGSIYALIALGYTMVFGVLRFINFAHGDVYMLGAFVGFYLGPKALKIFQRGAVRTLGAIGGVVRIHGVVRAHRHDYRVAVLPSAARPTQAHRAHHGDRGVSFFLENAGQYLSSAGSKSFPDLITDRALEIPAAWGRISDTSPIVSPGPGFHP